MSPGSIARVVFWMTGTLLSFSIMAVAVRELHGPLSLFEILAVRGLCGLIVFGAIVTARGELAAAVRSPRVGLHVLRNIVHFGATFAWAFGLTALPLATVFALEFTMPAWAAVLAVVLLGERMTRARAVAVLAGFVGVLVILRPGMQSFQPAALSVLASAVGFASAAVMTKSLTRSESTLTILLFMNAVQLPLNLLGCDPGFLAKITPAMTTPIVALCLAGLASHFCFTNAFRAGDAILVVPLDFLRIPLIAVVGAVLYGERLDPMVFIGAVVIVGGIIWNLRQEMGNRAGRSETP